MPSNSDKLQKSSPRKTLRFGAVILLLCVVSFYGNNAVQTYLGQQALKNISLGLLTLNQAMKVAKTSNKLVLADMSAIWCPSCRKLDKQVFSDERVKTQLNQDFVYARLEYDSPAGKSFMQKYQVTGFPTLLVLNTKGEKLVQLPIDYEPLAFLDTLEKVVAASH